MRACEPQLNPLELVLRGGPSIADLSGQGLGKFRLETAHEGQPGPSDRTGGSGTAACARPNRSTARASPTPRDASPAKTRAVPAMIPASRAGEWESSLTGLTKKPIQSKNRAISHRESSPNTANPSQRPRIRDPMTTAARFALTA